MHVKGRPSKAVAGQIRTVAKEHLTGYTSYFGTLTQPDLLAVEQAIRV